jgi:hypothetical protein
VPDVQRLSATLLPSLLALAFSAVACVGCAVPLGDARPCTAGDAAGCGEGRSCVAGRCRLSDTPISSTDALRYVLAPTDIAVVASSGAGSAGGGNAMPEAVALGRAAGGTLVLLLHFAATWRDDAEVLGAFVVLEALDDAPPPSTPITFEMARIVEPWQPGVVSWGRQPKLDVPRAAGSVRARPSAPLRIDVTPLVRDWGRRAADDHGLALLAHGDDAYGAVVSTGVARGAGPRLEVYVK